MVDALLDEARETFTDYGTWYLDLCEIARVGYPSGGGGGRSSGLSDPTSTAALGRDPARAERQEHDEDMKRLAALLRKIAKRKAWLNVRDAKNYDPYPIVCETCNDPIPDGIHRDGECQRCYRHRRRHDLPWPLRHVTPEEARRLGK